MASFIQTLTVSQSHTILTASFAFRDYNRPNSHLFIHVTNRHWALINSFKNTFYVPGILPGLVIQWSRILLTMRETDIITYKSLEGKAQSLWECKTGQSVLVWSGYKSFLEKCCLNWRMNGKSWRVWCICVCTQAHAEFFQIVEKKPVTFFKGPEERQNVEGGRGREREESSAEGTMGQGPQPPGRSERYQPRVRLVENGVIRPITGVKYKRNWWVNPRGFSSIGCLWADLLIWFIWFWQNKYCNTL